MLRQGVQGISDLVTLPGLINLDFADVRTIMSEAGDALLGIGMAPATGGRSRRPQQAVASPLLETSMDGARSILLSITGGRDLSLWEVNEAAKAVAEAAHPEANIIFGAMVDEKLDDAVWVTVVATGYGAQRRRTSAGGAAWRAACQPRAGARAAELADARGGARRATAQREPRDRDRAAATGIAIAIATVPARPWTLPSSTSRSSSRRASNCFVARARSQARAR